MKIKEFFRNKEWKHWDKSQWSILILVGALLMMIAIPVENGKEREEKTKEYVSVSSEEKKTNTDYAEDLEEKLEDVLSKIEGAGLVEVMVTLEDLGESVVEKDISHEHTGLEETATTGEIRTEKREQIGEETVYQEENSTKTPFVEKEKAPKIAGILVVAQGGEYTKVKQNISEAVMALFQIDVNRIKVVKMNIQEEED